MKTINFKKNLLAIVLMAFVALAANAQEKASPARTAEGTAAGSKITIKYSSPAVKGRVIWGDLVPLGQVWRAGADDATTFTTEKDILVEGKKNSRQEPIASLLFPGKLSLHLFSIR